ncbi:MAG: penicillin-insensitive murein endopeptidase [Gammaproteobacteria bacterium]|nr:penicillin-insensitive murein endopeptidase [Gammaproteobacteria bacterium]
MTLSSRSQLQADERILPRLLILISLILAVAAYGQEPSVCYGTTSNGKLENGWKLPALGSNFSTHWTVGRMVGRSFVHSSVHSVLLDAYEQLANKMPDRVFVYGETGWKEGGRFKPHKTHRNGLSVDFMVPVLDETGASVKLPSSVLNKWGYDLEFDSDGRLDDLQIDFDAIAEHVYQLDVIAKRQGIGIWRVIFDPQLQPHLESSPRWPYLKKNVQFSTKRSWVRHDEHYHVDFDVSCKPL